MNRAQDLFRPPRHHHEAVGVADELLHDAELAGCWMIQHGVQRRDHRHPHAPEEGKHPLAIGVAEDAVLMLNAQHVGVHIVEEPAARP